MINTFFTSSQTLNTMAQNESRLEDNYLHCDRYAGHSSAGIENFPQFTKFQDPETDLFYFSYLDDDDSVMFRSEGYPTESARDNGIDSVMRNWDIEERYKIVQFPDGKWYVSLRAGNHQEIARSCGYDTEEEAATLTPSGRAAKAAAMALSASNRNQDEYMDCELYGGYERDAEDARFAKFQAEDSMYYFAVYDEDGNVMFRSESYPNTGARDNGMNSVKRNWDIEERYKLIQDENDGKWYVSLRAGNHQEIARSCGYESEDLASNLTPSGRERVKAALAALAAVSTPQPESNREEDNYLACKDYLGHERHPEHNEFATFQHSDGEYYFVMYNDENNVVWRSEGYPTTAARDNGMASVIKNRDIPERIIEKEMLNGYIYYSLKAGNHQEIARSCPKKREDVIHPLAMMGIGAAGAAAGLVIDSEAAVEVPEIEIQKVEPEPIAVEAPAKLNRTPEEKEDDYLHCDEYKSKFVNDKQNNVALFKHENGQFYFVLYNEDGSVKLRSEGFNDAKTRDEELSGVLKYHDNAEMYTIIERSGHVIRILKDKTGREVGRSCLEKNPVAAAPVAEVATAAAAVVAAATQVDLPDASLPKVETPSMDVETPVVPPMPTVEGDTGGFKWWWLLPLLLLPLLFMLCNKCKAPEAKVTEVKKEEPKPAPVPATKVSVKSFLPVTLYFDNDQPDANTKAKTTSKSYDATYDAYYALRSEFAAKGDGAATSNFFDADVKKGMDDLRKLAAALKDILASGEKVNLKVKGFASPLAKTDYNEALTGRRVSSVLNYFKAYDASLANAIANGSLKLSLAPAGEGEAKGGVDNSKDKKGSIYGVAASKERRVEIIGIE